MTIPVLEGRYDNSSPIRYWQLYPALEEEIRKSSASLNAFSATVKSLAKAEALKTDDSIVSVTSVEKSKDVIFGKFTTMLTCEIKER